MEKSLDQKIATIMTSMDGVSKKLMGEGYRKHDGNRETRTCHYCQKVGHLGKDCYKRQRAQANHEDEKLGNDHGPQSRPL